jgi:xylulokinase
VPPGAGGLQFLPYLAGERVPELPDATGLLAGIRAGSLRPGVLYRAALEGATASLALGVERMKRLGLEARSVRLAGGGAENDLWAQLVADMLQVPAVRLAETESAALGAAVQAMATERADAGETVSIDALALRFVKTRGEELRPDAAVAPVYRELMRSIAGLTSRVFASRSGAPSM